MYAVNIQATTMAEEGRNGEQKAKRVERIRDNSWIFSCKWFSLSEESWRRGWFGGKEIKIFGLVILSLRFLLNISVKKPNKHLEMNLKIQTKILNRETNLGVVSMYIVAKVKGLDEVNYSNISRLWQ